MYKLGQKVKVNYPESPFKGEIERIEKWPKGVVKYMVRASDDNQLYLTPANMISPIK